MEKHRNFYDNLLEDYDPNLDYSGVKGERLARRLSALSEIGMTRDGGSNRPGFSLEERKARNLVKIWMEEAGLVVREDGAGNVFGRLSGKNDDQPAILSGSHVDSVPNGGHFDGPLGVLAALEVAEAWKESDFIPLRPYEVVIFVDEEGARFNKGLYGSLAMVGQLTGEEVKSLVDQKGHSFEEILNEQGKTVDLFVNSQRNLNEIEMFVEVHIEQGKVLEKLNVPVGVVTGIAGPCWIEITIKGQAGHAGNTPMDDRHDALVTASKLIVEIEKLPRSVSSSAVATVGKMNVHPNGVNVIPGEVQFYVDIRDINENTRDELVEKVLKATKIISAKHGLSCESQEKMNVRPVPVQKNIQKKIAESLKANNIKPVHLPSGAGHDAMVIGNHVPIGMLFVQSKDGISHNPNEWSALNDCIASVHVLKHFLENYER